MSTTAHFTIDTAAVKPTAAIATAARAGVAVALTSPMLRDLSAELGSEQQAMRWLIELANEVDRPMAVNVPTGGGTSTTVLLAPRHWTTERLQGWAGGMHEELEAMFGPAEIRAWAPDGAGGPLPTEPGAQP